MLSQQAFIKALMHTPFEQAIECGARTKHGLWHPRCIRHIFYAMRKAICSKFSLRCRLQPDWQRNAWQERSCMPAPVEQGSIVVEYIAVRLRRGRDHKDAPHAKPQPVQSADQCTTGKKLQGLQLPAEPCSSNSKLDQADC